MIQVEQMQLVQEVPAGMPVLSKFDGFPSRGVRTTELEFPTVDMRLLTKPGDVKEAAKLRSALQSWGLFALAGHGIPEELLDGILSVGKEFFHLPLDEKLEYAHGGDGEGYSANAPNPQFDWCDGLYLQVQPQEERRLQFWPSNPPSLRDQLHEYTLRSEQVAKPLLGAVARTLGLGERAFADQLGDGAATYAKFSMYPACPHSDDAVQVLKTRTNETVLTVFRLDHGFGGLQVRKDGNWVDVPDLGYNLLVIVGEKLKVMSNGLVKSPTHRAVTSDKERAKVLMFYQPDPLKGLGSTEEQLLNKGEPALYKNLKA